MRVLVTGASGNLGTALLRRLAAEPHVSVVGVARRPPPADRAPYAGVEWLRCDLGDRDAARTLAPALAGVDAVVHLAWAIQPNHDREATARTNIAGTRHLVEAVGAAGTPHLVHVSSLGAYSPGPKEPRVEEDWPTGGVRSSFYSRDKVAVERLLDRVERRRPELAVTRVRPTLVMQSDAASEIRRYFLGPLLPVRLVGRVGLPALPVPAGMRFQVVHADDVADALWRMVDRRATGAFNLAAEPAVGPEDLARLLGAVRLPAPGSVLRQLAWLTWQLRLQPTDPGWIDLVLSVPLLSSRRAREELGWEPRHDPMDALREVLAGMVGGDGTASPVLRPQERSAAGRLP